MAGQSGGLALHDFGGANELEFDLAAVRELGPETRAHVRFERLDRQIFEHMRVLARFLGILLCASAASAAVMPSVTYVSEHVGDAVKWQGWGKAAFERARQQDKLLALGIGSFYSHETRLPNLALDGDAAPVATLNDRFVPVLVDRAEWPWLASAYAAAANRTDTD